MSVQTLSPAKLRKQGIEALVKELGPIGMARWSVTRGRKKEGVTGVTP